MPSKKHNRNRKITRKRALSTIKQPLSATTRKRLKKLPGKARQYLDPKTGNVYSRRQFEKGRQRPQRKNKQAVDNKYRHYLQVRDRYISSQKRMGKVVSKRAAMNSAELKKVVKDLHSKDVKKKIAAIEKVMLSDRKVDWTPYIKRWQEGEL